MRLETERLILRPLGPADVTPTYVAWLNDPAVNRYLETRHGPQTLESVAAYVTAAAARPDEALFGIFLKAGDGHIGNIKLGPIHAIHGLADISLFIGDVSVWGRGYASEAIARVARHAFEDRGVQKLSAGLYAANLGSEKAFLKAGFAREGLRRAHYDFDGTRSDIVELGLVRP